MKNKNDQCIDTLVYGALMEELHFSEGTLLVLASHLLGKSPVHPRTGLLKQPRETHLSNKPSTRNPVEHVEI